MGRTNCPLSLRSSAAGGKWKPEACSSERAEQSLSRKHLQPIRRCDCDTSAHLRVLKAAALRERCCNRLNILPPTNRKPQPLLLTPLTQPLLSFCSALAEHRGENEKPRHHSARAPGAFSFLCVGPVCDSEAGSDPASIRATNQLRTHQ